MSPRMIPCLLAEAAFAFLFPLTAAIFWKIRAKTKILPFFLGAAVFFLFAQILEGTVHTLFLQIITPVATFLNSHFLFYALYGALMAGLFEESGRLFAFRLTKKWWNDRPNAVAYGLGHGGFECMMTLGAVAVLNLVLVVLTSSGMTNENITTVLGVETVSALSEGLSSITPLIAVMAIAERLSAILLHVSLSVLVWYAVSKNQIIFWALAVFLHFAFDFLVVLSASALPIMVVELLLAAASLLIAFFIFRKTKGDDNNEFRGNL